MAKTPAKQGLPTAHKKHYRTLFPALRGSGFLLDPDRMGPLRLFRDPRFVAPMKAVGPGASRDPGGGCDRGVSDAWQIGIVSR